MKVSDIKKYFVTKTAACKAIKVKGQLFAQWENYGYIPLHHQFAFEKYTKKELMACTQEIMIVSRRKYKLKLKESKND